MGKSEKVYYGGCGDRTHDDPKVDDPKVHGLSTTPYVEDFSGVLVRLTTCNWLTYSLPKLSLITRLRPFKPPSKIQFWNQYKKSQISSSNTLKNNQYYSPYLTYFLENLKFHHPILKTNQYCSPELIHSKSSIKRIFHTKIKIEISKFIIQYSKPTNQYCSPKLMYNMFENPGVRGTGWLAETVSSHVIRKAIELGSSSVQFWSAAVGLSPSSHVVTPIIRKSFLVEATYG